MAFNTIQFQHGMSLPEFIERFGTEEQCAQAVKAARWPGGFRCLRCDAAEHWVVGHGARKLFECQACRYQTSLTVGSLFEHTKLPLRTWFLAIYLLSQAKTGLSSLALKRHLGVSYPTAWALQHKINHAMALREGRHQLAGTVQLDDAYLGGEHPGGKPGRGSENKTPFVAAVSLNDKGRPQFLKLNRVSGFTIEAIKGWAKANLAPTAAVVSDGLGCFAAVTAAGCTHCPSWWGTASRAICRSSSGSTRSWAISRPRCTARSTRWAGPSMPTATSPRSPTASIAASTCATCAPG
jgi:transposase-like protein